MSTEVKSNAAPSPMGSRYVELTQRLSALNGGMSTVIAGLLVASAWGHWRVALVVGGAYALLIAFNIWTNLVLLPRYGQTADVFRLSINILVGVGTGHLTGWPVAAWLWLPFNALAFDHLDPRIARWTLIGMCVAQDGAALLDGRPLVNPLCFTLLALFCWEISRRRFRIIREMLGQSDAQRLETERANGLLRDSHEQLRTETEARLAIEAELRQAQRLESVGRLAAGVAHEINTPIQFVTDSVHFLREGSTDLLRVVEKLQAVHQAVLSGQPTAQAAADATAALEAADLAYLFERLPAAFDRSLDGLGRVATIVRSMKYFAHPDSKEMVGVDLNRAIESMLTIASNEYRYVAVVETDFGQLPVVRCHPGDVNQVLLSILVNAAHAIGEVVKGTDAKGRIGIRTRQEGEAVVISISDTGNGIPESIRDRIFDPFFTTKGVGKGTGQGLSIARSVIVERHKGQLSFDSVPGKGTTFFLRLPIGSRSAAGAVAAAA